VCAKSTTSLTVPDHFYRPPRSTRWYVRLVAPESIRDLVDKVEFRQSTGHSDIHKAKPVGLALLAEKRREWASLEAQAGQDRIDFGVKPTTLTGPLIDSICAARFMPRWRSTRTTAQGLTAWTMMPCAASRSSAR